MLHDTNHNQLGIQVIRAPPPTWVYIVITVGAAQCKLYPGPYTFFCFILLASISHMLNFKRRREV